MRCYISGKKPPITQQKGSIEFVQYGDEFIDYSMKLAGIREGDLQGKRIMLDFLNGSAGLEITKALIRCGADVNARNLIPDGSFPNGEPNPIVVSSIQPTWDEIKKGGYDFGFCYDGDGDRMDVMNAEGVQLTPSFNMAILLPEIVRLFNTRMGYEHIQSYTGVKSNPLSIRRQYEANSNIHLIRNGHSFIKEALRINMENEYVAAVEETAHYYMNFPYDPEDFKQGLAPTENTLFFTLLTARLWSQNPKAYQSAFEEQKSLYREREWGGHFFDERIVPAVMDEIEDKFKEERVQIIKHMADGGTLDATIFRYGLEEMHEKNDLDGPWFQVSQRISRNEEGIARWEVISSREQFVSQCVNIIKEITDRYVEQGKAEYFN